VALALVPELALVKVLAELAVLFVVAAIVVAAIVVEALLVEAAPTPPPLFALEVVGVAEEEVLEVGRFARRSAVLRGCRTRAPETKSPLLSCLAPP